ncbi:MAG: VOC family protein [Chitinophagaceae bacterium]|nr:VOC family protein [Chitinophagaceae bacterium]MCB9045629.1 VOC family protein [Chitinophagales bacterium]
MSNTFQGLRTVVYMMPDLKAATRWYTDILGIEPYFNTPYYVGYNVGGYELGLHPQPDEMVAGDNVSAYWGVDDVQATVDKLIAAGATAHEKPSDVGEGIIIASVKDPWGNVFGVINNPHFKPN